MCKSDKQVYRQTDRQIDRQTDVQTDTDRHRQMYKQIQHSIPPSMRSLQCNYVLSHFWSPTPASKPGSTGLLTHVRGQGLMDLEFENDGDLWPVGSCDCHVTHIAIVQRTSQLLQHTNMIFPMSHLTRDLCCVLVLAMMVRFQLLLSFSSGSSLPPFPPASCHTLIPSFLLSFSVSQLPVCLFPLHHLFLVYSLTPSNLSHSLFLTHHGYLY